MHSYPSNALSPDTGCSVCRPIAGPRIGFTKIVRDTEFRQLLFFNDELSLLSALSTYFLDHRVTYSNYLRAQDVRKRVKNV